MSKQLEMFRPGELELKDPKGLRWGKNGDYNWESFVRNVGKGHICQKCGEIINPGGPASVTIDTDVPKKNLEAEDFKKIKYWHHKVKCPS